MRSRLLAVILIATSLMGCVAAEPEHQTPEPEPTGSVTTDVVYGHKDGLAMTFDVYRPAIEPNGAAVISILSGGWQSSWDLLQQFVETADGRLRPMTAEEIPEGLGRFAAHSYAGLLERGFTVFAVVRPSDMAIVDQITALHREYGPVFVYDPDDPGDPDDVSVSPFLDNLPVLEILDRPPDGWGCVKFIDPDPVYVPQYQLWLPAADQEECGLDQMLLDEAQALIWAQMSPQVPERLVVVQSVPEPGAVLQLAAGAATLSALWMARRRRG